MQVSEFHDSRTCIALRPDPTRRAGPAAARYTASRKQQTTNREPAAAARFTVVRSLSMSASTFTLSAEIRDYLLRTTVRECDTLAALRTETARLPQARMQISPEQGQLLTLLVSLCGATRAIEIGTFTGYSAICIARGLAPGGSLLACDRSAEWTDIARRYWQRAGLDDRITLRLAPALETLATLTDGPQRSTFDFAFIDADKQNYTAYYEQTLSLLRPGGLLAVDNALWSGRILEPERSDEETLAIRELNQQVGSDPRVTCSLVPIGDGLLLVRKNAD